MNRRWRMCVNSIVLLTALAFSFCGRSTHKSKHRTFSPPEIQDTLPARPVISWHIDTIPDTVRPAAYLEKFTSQQQDVLFAMNRLSKKRLRKGTVLVIPDTFLVDLRDYSPLPFFLSIVDTFPKFIAVSQRVQAIGMYEYGKLVRWGPVSSGKQSTQTPNGLYYTNWKSKRKISTVDEEWIMPWYFNISNRGGIGLHEYELPGYPASHSCVRLLQQDAKWIFYWADSWTLTEGGGQIKTNGTPVVIFGTYNYNSDVPWRQLVTDKKANDLAPEEMNELESQCRAIKRVLVVDTFPVIDTMNE